MAQTIESVVDGGKASAGPPLGPALGPAGVNIGQVVAAINEKTRSYNGMKVPIKVHIDDKKNFTIEVGTPPASALVMMKAGITKGSGEAKKSLVGNLTLEGLLEIVEMKQADLQGANRKTMAKEIIGTCRSMGVSFEGMHPQEAMQAIADGRYDEHLQ